MNTNETPMARRIREWMNRCAEFLKAMEDPRDLGYDARLRRLESEVDKLKALLGSGHERSQILTD